MAYTLTGRTGSTVRFTPSQNGVIDGETENYTSSVTSNPIENGSSINDHVNNEAGTFAISGVIIGGDAAINSLKAMRDSRDIITYTGHARVTNLVFTALKFDYSHKNKDGASFSATFKRIQITSPDYIPSGQSLSMVGQDSGRSSNRQLAQTSSTGMKAIAVITVSATSLEKYSDAYKSSRNGAPLSRITGGYNGLDFYR